MPPVPGIDAMIKSQYIADVVNLLLDDDREGALVKMQLPFINDEKYTYTDGRGLFVKFGHSGEILPYKSPKDRMVLDSVKIQVQEDSIEANAILFFRNGIIDSLEIWCYSGNYPMHDPPEYKLTKIGKS